MKTENVEQKKALDKTIIGTGCQFKNLNRYMHTLKTFMVQSCGPGLYSLKPAYEPATQSLRQQENYWHSRGGAP
jgi:hypothetical protein